MVCFCTTVHKVTFYLLTGFKTLLWSLIFSQFFQNGRSSICRRSETLTKNIHHTLPFVLFGSIDEDSPKITIGSCVDLFPLVRKVLNTKYEE